MPNIEESGRVYISQWPPPKKKKRVPSSSGNFYTSSVKLEVTDPGSSHSAITVTPGKWEPSDLDSMPGIASDFPAPERAASNSPLKRFKTELETGKINQLNGNLLHGAIDRPVVQTAPNINEERGDGGLERDSSQQSNDTGQIRLSRGLHQECRSRNKKNLRRSKSPLILPNGRVNKCTSKRQSAHAPDEKEKRKSTSKRHSAHSPCRKEKETSCSKYRAPLTPYWKEDGKISSKCKTFSVPCSNKDRRSSSVHGPPHLSDRKNENVTTARRKLLHLVSDSGEVVTASQSGPPRLLIDKGSKSPGKLKSLPYPHGHDTVDAAIDSDPPYLQDDKKLRPSDSVLDALRLPVDEEQQHVCGEQQPLCRPENREPGQIVCESDALHTCNSEEEINEADTLVKLPTVKVRKRTSRWGSRSSPCENERSASELDLGLTPNFTEKMDSSEQSQGNLPITRKKYPRIVFNLKVNEDTSKMTTGFVSKLKDSMNITERSLKLTPRCKNRMYTSVVTPESVSSLTYGTNNAVRSSGLTPHFKNGMNFGNRTPGFMSNFQEKMNANEWSPGAASNFHGGMNASAREPGIENNVRTNVNELTSENTTPKLKERISIYKWGQELRLNNNGNGETAHANSFINEAPAYEHSIFQDVEFIGDSMLLRLFTHLTGRKCFPNHESVKAWHKLTVGGQTLAQALKKLKVLKTRGQMPATNTILVMLGTNDILKTTRVPEMKWQIRTIVHMLAGGGGQVVVLTIPPIPRLDRTRDPDAWKRLCQYNQFIRKELNGDNCTVIDIFPLFVDKDVVRKHLFERLMGYGLNRRPDEIHWNLEGITTITEVLCKEGLL